MVYYQYLLVGREGGELLDLHQPLLDVAEARPRQIRYKTNKIYGKMSSVTGNMLKRRGEISQFKMFNPNLSNNKSY